MPAGRTDIDGDNVYAVNVEVDSYIAADAQYEAHHNYADVQVQTDPAESFYFSFEPLREKVAYDAKNDVVLYHFDNKGIHLTPQLGECMVFFPHELHLPKFAVKHQKLRKVIFKVKM